MPDSATFSTSALTIRPATAADAAVLFQLIQALADYEKLSHAVTGSVAALARDLSGDRPACEAILVEHDHTPIGFALFFANYSTFLTKPGIYLEDLFVLPEYRGQGVGKTLLSYLAQLAQQRDCGRLEWSVLDWNEPAIAFYRRMGATLLEEWRICRVTGDAIAVLANLQPPA
ncbi:MAG: GNAT family N-acetyltransferase [Oculatellaceae cyanobacterium bins.114]|nr:GNAT family N-acetyltransferase [Oculatellaceae cyanobacterium bins.114]